MISLTIYCCCAKLPGDVGERRGLSVPGPLQDLLVVERTWGLPGAIAGMVLADYGATVVKIERPGGGPDAGTVLRRVVDRGKWSIELDPADPTTQQTIEALLARADVVLAATPPDGRAPTHGRLVHCTITGYGLDGPLCDRPGYDALVAARFGLMAEQAGHRKGPIFLGHPAIDYVTAFLAVMGVLAALHVRHRTGAGQHVDTSLLDGALAASSMNWWWNERDLSYLARTGDELGFGRNRLITDLFECSDGEYVMVHTGGDGGFKRTMDVLGLGDRVRAVDGLEMATPLDDDEYHAARHLVPEVFVKRPRDEWLRRFHAADLAALPVLRPEEVFADDQVRHAGVAVDVPDPDFGVVRQIGPVVRFRTSPAGPTSPAPGVGEQNGRLDELLSARPRSRPEPDRTSPEAPLAGLRVVDFSAFFATAFGARLLSDLGADVIKVEPVGGDQMRPLPDLFEGAQRGKRNLAVDMRTSSGAEIVRRLVRTADVVMHNLRPGKAEKLGIGYEQCVALNPSLVYCYLPGFGSSGPKSELKSFAPLVSGFTGMLYIGAGAGNPPNRRVLGNEDLYNGFLGALSVLMAIQHRNRTGEGQYVESPHLHSSLLVRTEQCIDRDGRPVAGLQLDAEQTGWGPLYRLYRTQDDWIALACVGDRAFTRLAGAIGRLDLATDVRFRSHRDRAENGDALAAELGAVFAGLSSAEAFERLDGADVPCEIPAPDPYVPDFLWDEWAFATGRVFEHHHPEHGWIREIGHCVRMSATPLANKGTSARLGQHSRELLGELGYSREETDALLLDGVCREP
jgi:crotonobetainyl-CoA:carnitine CoA-transferase CaiB-like acyl-CoA transferase